MPMTIEEDDQIDQFAAGAETEHSDIQTALAPYFDEGANRDPECKDKKAINLRVNPYQHAQLRYVAAHEDRSLQWVMSKLLFGRLEETVREYVTGKVRID